MAAGHFTGSAISAMLVGGIGIYGSCIAGATLQVLSMLVEPFNAYMGTVTSLYGACAIVFCYFWYVKFTRDCVYVSYYTWNVSSCPFDLCLILHQSKQQKCSNIAQNLHKIQIINVFFFSQII